MPGLNCLAVCGLRDGIASIGQFCVDTRLAFKLTGDVKKGLFFRGSESLPIGAAIRPVAELLDYFLTVFPAGWAGIILLKGRIARAISTRHPEAEILTGCLLPSSSAAISLLPASLLPLYFTATS